MKIKSLLKSFLLILTVALCLPSCEKISIPSENEEFVSETSNSLLQVRTRASETGGEGSVSTPVTVYVFKGEECVALKTLYSTSESLSFILPKGTYYIFAIGGASADDYILPSKEEASPSMTIALREGKSHGDLMVAQSDATLTEGEENSVTLGMQRRVMMIENINLKNVPNDVTEVQVILASLYKNIAGMDYAAESENVAIPLQRQDDGTWGFNKPMYLLPPSKNPTTITVRLNRRGTNPFNYTYTTDKELESGYKIRIQGEFVQKDIRLDGVITGAEWSDRDISFSFTEEVGANGNDNNDKGDDNEDNDIDYVTEFPQPKDTYKNCFVLSVEEDEAAGTATVLLLSPNYKKINFSQGVTQDQVKEKVEAELPECFVEGMKGWRLMTTDEGRYVFFPIRQDIPSWKGIPSADRNNYKYISTQNGEFEYFSIGTVSTPIGSSFTTNLTYILQPVTTITLHIIK